MSSNSIVKSARKFISSLNCFTTKGDVEVNVKAKKPVSESSVSSVEKSASTSVAALPTEIPECDIWGIIFDLPKSFPSNKVVYVDANTSTEYTFEDVKKLAESFGTALRSKWNWEKSDVMAILSANCCDFAAVVLGVQWANGVVSPANPAYSAAEFAHQLKDSGAKAIVTQPSFLHTAKEAARLAGLEESRIIVMGDKQEAPVEAFREFVGDFRNALPLDRIPQQPGDLAYLVYSSGTTGLPKGVKLIHRNITSQILMVNAGHVHLSWNGGPEGKGDTIMAVLPFFHIYGLTMHVHHLLFGGLKAVVLPSFSLEFYCQLVEKHKVTFAYVVPPILLALSKSPLVKKYDLSSVRMLMSAAAPLTRELVESLYANSGLKVMQGYGLSETSPTTHLQRWEDWRATAGSIGKLLPYMQGKIIDNDGRDAAVGEVGELILKGPNVTPGYLNNPTASANAFTSDGWFRTGDVGYQDSEGNFFITDRKKELIKVKGFQVAPAELEGLLTSHPLVQDVCVIGVYDESQATELPRAFVVLKEKREASDHEQLESEIQTWVADQVAHYKRLKGGVVFVDSIAKTASGKILRRVMKEKMGLTAMPTASKNPPRSATGTEERNEKALPASVEVRVSSGGSITA